MKTVLVTGAAGTVGTYLVALAEAAGWRVIASDLTARGVRTPVRGEVRPADLTDASALPALVRGCDAVLHTAALLDVSAEPEALRAVNAEATERLHAAAAEAGAGRFVHLSAARLYAPAGARPLREDAPLAERGPYAASKREAEERLMARRGGPAWTIVRPAPIYGRRGRHFAASLLALGPLLRLATPVLPRPEGGPRGTMVHAEDVARAMLFVLENEAAAERIFNVSDGDALPLGERLALTFDAYGLASTPVPVPVGPLLSRAASLVEHGPRWLQRGVDRAGLTGWAAVVRRHDLKPALRPRFDREVLELAHDDLVVDASALGALGWAPRYARFEAGWSAVLRIYQAERWVPRY